MRHYFLDTNVVIDFLAERIPFWAEAADLMQAGVNKEVRLYVASLSFTAIYYTVRRSTSSARARQLLIQLKQLVEIVAVDATIIQQALTSGFADFEDGVQVFAAASNPAIEHIVTRDKRHFTASVLPVVSPAEALQLLE